MGSLRSFIVMFVFHYYQPHLDPSKATSIISASVKGDTICFCYVVIPALKFKKMIIDPFHFPYCIEHAIKTIFGFIVLFQAISTVCLSNVSDLIENLQKYRNSFSQNFEIENKKAIMSFCRFSYWDYMIGKY